MNQDKKYEDDPTNWQNYNHALGTYIHHSLTAASCRDSIKSSNNQTDKNFIKLFDMCRQLVLIQPPPKKIVDKTDKEKERVIHRYQMAPLGVLRNFLKSFPREVLASRIKDIDHQISISIIELHCRTILHLKSLKAYLADQHTSVVSEPENTGSLSLSALKEIEAFQEEELMPFLASCHEQCLKDCVCQSRITQVNTKFIELSHSVAHTDHKIKPENIHYWNFIDATLSPQAGATIDNQQNVNFYLDKEDILRKRADNQRVIRYKYLINNKTRETLPFTPTVPDNQSIKLAFAVNKGVKKSEDPSMASAILTADILSPWPCLQAIPPQKWDLSAIPLSTLSELIDKCRLFNASYFKKNVEDRLIDKWSKEDWWIENSLDPMLTTVEPQTNQDEPKEQEDYYDPDRDDTQNELKESEISVHLKEDEEDEEGSVNPEETAFSEEILDDKDNEEVKNIKLFLRGISGIQKETANLVLSAIAKGFRNYVGQKNQLRYAQVLCEKLKGKTAEEITRMFPRDQYPHMSGDMKDNIDKCSHSLVNALCEFPVFLENESANIPLINQSLIDLIVLNPYTIVYFTENTKSQKHLEGIVSFLLFLPRTLFGIWACLTETNRAAITKHLSDATNASLHKALAIGEPLHLKQLVINIYLYLDRLTLVAEKLADKNRLIAKDDYNAIQRELILSIKNFELQGGGLTGLITDLVNTTDSSAGLRLWWFIHENQQTFKLNINTMAEDQLLTSAITTAIVTIAESVAQRPSSIRFYEFSNFALNSIISALIAKPALLSSFWEKLDEAFKRYLSRQLMPETFNNLWLSVGYSKPPEIYAKLNCKADENALKSTVKQQLKEYTNEPINKAGKSGVNVGEYLFEQVGSLAKIAEKYLEPSDWLSED